MSSRPKVSFTDQAYLQVPGQEAPLAPVVPPPLKCTMPNSKMFLDHEVHLLQIDNKPVLPIPHHEATQDSLWKIIHEQHKVVLE